MAVPNDLPSPAVVRTYRRRTTRMPAGDRLEIEIVPVLVPAEILDISFGGFSIETRYTLRVGAIQLFRFLSPPARLIELKARVVHSRRKAANDQTARYVAGCEFVPGKEGRTARLIEELIDSATGQLSFEALF